MEPLSALSIAASVVQFVDFGRRLFGEGVEIYTEGRSSRNLELSAIAADFENLSREVNEKSRLLPAGPPGTSQDTFLRLCKECKESFAAVIRTIWSADRIQGINSRLDDIKGQIMLAAIVHMWTGAAQESTNVEAFTSQQAKIIKLLDRNDETTRKFSEKLAEVMAKDTSRSQTLTERDRLVKRAWESKLLPHPNPAGLRLADTLEQRQRTLAVNHSITSTILFGSIGDREEAIAEAHAATFKWIFQKPRTGVDGNTLWSDFPRWLEGPSNDIYWVGGKLGAGKSTLMKYIPQNPNFRMHLEKWSGNLPVFIAGFYSWNAGTEMQRSREGLYQDTLLSNTHFAREPYCRTMAGTTFNLMLLIDGLDEFEGDHRDLITFIQELNTRDGVKICTSSRPWNVFEDAYKRGPMLKLEDLTREDMEGFLRSEFGRSEAFADLQHASPDQATKLLNSIADKAQGVFLWVSIVVKSLLVSLSEGDRLSELQSTLDSLPVDISQLYERIWNRIEPKYHHEASRYFQLIETLRGFDRPTYLQTLWLADDDTGYDFSLVDATEASTTSALNVTKRRLNSRTRGLLETQDSGRVDYLHRTARDWVLGNWDRIVSGVGQEFDPPLVLLKALSIQILAIAHKIDKRDKLPKVDVYAQNWADAIELVLVFANAMRSESTRSRA
ncbi:hypothetical protein B0H66DRAFT_587764 [Apodospora peruviana]|uniref:DUF7791 domain-containing protein n=1 Tax=Apodospora peruviana TaxID=516989 RepID=A0AAE0MA05_9PEZI|nr:hypothetical protein B0H66DRAFT_587764 [Apodospora peruviana]